MSADERQEAVSEAQKAVPETPAPEPTDVEPTTPTDEHDSDDPVKKAGREAAGYRRKLREAEAQRDTLAGRLDTMQRAEVERLAATQLNSPADLWLGGADLADLLDEQGQVDPAKVSARVAEVTADRPHWRLPAPSFDGGARGSTPDTAAPSFADVLRRRP